MFAFNKASAGMDKLSAAVTSLFYTAQPNRFESFALVYDRQNGMLMGKTTCQL